MRDHPQAYQIKSRLFVAGLVVRQDDVVTAAAPEIWRQVVNKTLAEVKDICRIAGWTLEKI